MRTKYLFRSILSLPLLPLLAYQGKRVRSTMPALPEPAETEGYTVGGDRGNLRILSIGESSISGVGVKRNRVGLVGQLASAMASNLSAKVSWKIYAKSGFTAKQVRERIIPNIQEKAADLIVIGLGANDAFVLNRPGRWGRQIQKIILDLKEQYNDTPIVFTNLPPINEIPAFSPTIKLVVGNLIQFFRDELIDISSRFDKVYFCSDEMVIEDFKHRYNLNLERDQFFSDGVHPSEITYEVWGKDLSKYILSQPTLRQRFETILAY